MNKNIYYLPNSNKAADPIDLRRKLIIHTKGELGQLIDMFNGGTDYEKALASDRLIDATRKTFGLLPITEAAGVNDDVVMEYLAHFLEWLSTRLDKNSNPLQNYQPCTNCP